MFIRIISNRALQSVLSGAICHINICETRTIQFSSIVCGPPLSIGHGSSVRMQRVPYESSLTVSSLSMKLGLTTPADEFGMQDPTLRRVNLDYIHLHETLRCNTFNVSRNMVERV